MVPRMTFGKRRNRRITRVEINKCRWKNSGMVKKYNKMQMELVGGVAFVYRR